MQRKKTIKKLDKDQDNILPNVYDSQTSVQQKASHFRIGRKVNAFEAHKVEFIPMVKEDRQESISNPSSIFKKLREKSSAQPVRQQGERTRETMKPNVPYLDDEEIVELCKRYPVKPGEA